MIKLFKEKVFENKRLMRWASLAFALVLVVTVAPYIKNAWGGDGDGPLVEETIPDATPIAEVDFSEDSEDPSTEDPEEEQIITTSEEESEEEDEITTQDSPITSITWSNETIDNVPTKVATISAGDTAQLSDVLTVQAAEGYSQYKLTVDGVLEGRIEVKANTTLYLEGTGEINGLKGGSVILVRGNDAKLILNKDQEGAARGKGLTIWNGSGTNLENDSNGANCYGYPSYATGGGIQVSRAVSPDSDDKTNGGTLKMYNGTITNNEADGGGGIFVDRNCHFLMNNGVVSNNTANKHEGGGIFIAAYDAKINAGDIVGNATQTVDDWGGGGIFVESKGKLTLPQVLVTENTANGLGGGIAGCPHAAIALSKYEDGAAVFGNEVNFAEGSSPKNPGLYGLGKRANGKNYVHYQKSDGTNANTLRDTLRTYKVGGDVYAYSAVLNPQGGTNNFSKSEAKDFYCTRTSYVVGSDLGQAGSIAWTGRIAGPDGSTHIEVKKGDSCGEAAYTLGLTNTLPKGSSVSRTVVVKNNYSNTHGGGMATNGTIEVGSVPDKPVINPWNVPVTFKKELWNLDDKNILPADQAGKYKFGLFTKEGVQISTATNAANGAIEFFVDPSDSNVAKALENNAGTETESGYTYELFAKELSNGTDFIYDDKEHPVSVTVETSTSTTPSTEEGFKLTTTTHTVTNVSYGTVNDQSAEKFINKVNPEVFSTTIGNVEIKFTKQLDNALTDESENLIADEQASAAGINTSYTFVLYASKTETKEDGTEVRVPDTSKPLAKATNSKADVVFKFTHSEESDLPSNESTNEVLINLYPNKENLEEGRHEVFFVKEVTGDDESVSCDKSWHKVDLSFQIEKENEKNIGTELHPRLETVYKAVGNWSSVLTEENGESIKDNGNEIDGKVFKNLYHPKGSISLSGVKEYYGTIATEFSFTMQRVDAPDENLKLVLPNSEASQDEVYSGTTGEFKENNKAEIIFEKIEFDQKDTDYWYAISERNDVNGVQIDPTYYVVKISTKLSNDGLNIEPSISQVYYAERVSNDNSLELTELNFVNGQPPEIEFTNIDESMVTMSIAGYPVDAATDEPLEKECFVDPKIYKELIGRSLQPNEFEFQLIKLAANEVDENGNAVPDWSQTKGEVISQTKNDRYGMVDFDAANDVTGGKWDSPSCLYYTEPGTYYYRVVEVGNHQATVKYSDQIITFTTVIDYDETKENLVCKDMYYGTVIDGKNERYSKELDESYSDSPDWHPTMTNYAKGMDLQVRKTSELDRDKGLEGATYALYMANDGSGTDILIDEGQTSDENGVITFKDVNLRERTLYYFKEVAAPDGHTVSEFRSDYFYLMPVYDSANENIIGYKLDYAENKDEFMQQVSNEPNSAEDEIVISAMSKDDALISTQANDSATANNDKFVVTYDKDGGVYDEATKVEFNKLDTRTHEWVEGAKLQIVKKDNGQVVNEWVSGKKAEKLEATLNVETDYILREVDAPEGYEKADDVVFRIDQYGAVRIVEGDSNGNAEISGDVITLYDTMLDVENVTTEYRETPGDEGEDGEGTFLAKTGDILKIAGIAILAIAAICGIVFALRRRSKNQA